MRASLVGSRSARPHQEPIQAQPTWAPWTHPLTLSSSPETEVTALAPFVTSSLVQFSLPSDDSDVIRQTPLSTRDVRANL